MRLLCLVLLVLSQNESITAHSTHLRPKDMWNRPPTRPILTALEVSRGGGASITSTTTTKRLAKKTLVRTATAVALATLVYFTKASWQPFFDKDKIQATTLDLLEQLRPSSGDPLATLRALSIYASGMAVWELLGLSTIPVETAAGMVFGGKAAGASLVGKLTGAGLAFGLGRSLLGGWARRRLSSNAVFQLLADQDDPLHGPQTTAFLMKFSCFPEFIKNFGSALLPSIAPRMFLTATAFHGGSFTLLWTWWGVDAARRLADDSLPVNVPLRVALGVAAVVGIVLTPLVMAWWIRDLQQHASDKARKNKRSWWR